MRSTDSSDYQAVPRSVSVMAKAMENGASTGLHRHARGQVLYATGGLMVARTVAGAWAVPTGYALLIPPMLMHDIWMHGRVEMVTAYIAPETANSIMPANCHVIRVSRLLDATLQALAQEEIVYDPEGRGGHLAALIVDEVAQAEPAALTLPMPTDKRLRRMCEEAIDDPGKSIDIDTWAEIIGVSRRTLTRRIRQETGLSFGDWRRRLRHLRTIALEAEGVPMKIVAAQVGYRSPQALKAMLRRATTRRA